VQKLLLPTENVPVGQSKHEDVPLLYFPGAQGVIPPSLVHSVPGEQLVQNDFPVAANVFGSHGCFFPSMQKLPLSHSLHALESGPTAVDVYFPD
jgi:hypothetical protein